jgi:lauroyl/myristoyl acyltransferase
MGLKRLLYNLLFLYPAIYGFFCYYRKKERRREIENKILLFYDQRMNPGGLRRIVRGILKLRGLKKLNRRLIPLIDADFIEHFVKAEGLHHLDHAVKEGRGVVLMSSHFGNPHLSINALRMMGYNVKALKGGALRKANPSRFEYYESWDNTVFLHDRSLSGDDRKRRILDILQSGGILHHMADAAEGRRKELTSFLGREMGFPTGLIHLAHQAKAALVPIFYFYKNGRLRLILEEAIDDHWKDGEKAYRRIVTEYAKRLEAYFLAYPEQYIGIYGPTVLSYYYQSHRKGELP